MKKIETKLRLNKVTVGFLNAKPQTTSRAVPDFAFSEISQTKGTIYHCPSVPFVCRPTVN